MFVVVCAEVPESVGGIAGQVTLRRASMVGASRVARMIRFCVHDPSALRTVPTNGGESFDLRSAFLVGVDGRPTRGVMEARRGEIVAAVSGDQPFGLSLLVDLGAGVSPGELGSASGREPVSNIASNFASEFAGARMQVQTCFLPPRAEPYELFLEFARWTIKQFIEDCERWQMWNPSRHAEAFERWEAARDVFREALRTVDPLEAERLSRRALAIGLSACEALASRHAALLLAKRFSKRAASGASLGVCVEAAAPPNPASAAVSVASRFDVIALRTPWRRLETKPGTYDFKSLDAWVKWAVAAKKRIVLGPLVDFSTRDGVPTGLPDHVLAARGNHERMAELLWNHTRKIAERYRDAARVFIPASGANCAGWHTEGIDRMVEYVRTTVYAVRDARQDAQIVLEIRSPGAESWRGVKGTAWPSAFVQRLVAENLSLAAVGVRFEQGALGDPVRDLMTNARILDDYLGKEVPIIITGFGIPSVASPEQSVARGHWRGGASNERQKEWGDAMTRLAMSRGFVEAVWWSRLEDVAENSAGSTPAGSTPARSTDGLLDVAGNIKPIAERLLALRRAMSPTQGTAVGAASPSVRGGA
jgi:hypothetical protein